MQTLDGEWQEKQFARSTFHHARRTQRCNLICRRRFGGAVHYSRLGKQCCRLMVAIYATFLGAFPDLILYLICWSRLRHLAASYLSSRDDIARIDRLTARRVRTGAAATNDVHYHGPNAPLQDGMTAIANKVTVAQAGHLLHARVVPKP
jgi:hypothetical protein